MLHLSNVGVWCGVTFSYLWSINLSVKGFKSFSALLPEALVYFFWLYYSTRSKCQLNYQCIWIEGILRIFKFFGSDFYEMLRIAAPLSRFSQFSDCVVSHASGHHQHLLPSK